MELSEQEKIAAAEQRAATAESAARRAEIQIEVLKMKAADLEKSAAARIEAAASCAVSALVRAGKINCSDVLAQDSYKIQFIHDPGLIELLLMKPANRKII